MKPKKLKVDWHQLAVNLCSIKPLRTLSREHGYYFRYLDRFFEFEADQPSFEDGVYWLDVHFDLCGAEATRGLIMGRSHPVKTLQENGLVTCAYLAKKYGINRQFMTGVIQHSENGFPEPRGEKGNVLLYDEKEVEAWLGARSMRELPHLQKAVFHTNDEKKESKENDFKYHGVGGKAEGEDLVKARQFYLMVSKVGRAA